MLNIALDYLCVYYMQISLLESMYYKEMGSLYEFTTLLQATHLFFILGFTK